MQMSIGIEDVNAVRYRVIDRSVELKFRRQCAIIGIDEMLFALHFPSKVVEPGLHAAPFRDLNVPALPDQLLLGGRHNGNVVVRVAVRQQGHADRKFMIDRLEPANLVIKMFGRRHIIDEKINVTDPPGAKSNRRRHFVLHGHYDDSRMIFL